MRYIILLLLPLLLEAGSLEKSVSLNPEYLKIRVKDGYAHVYYPEAAYFGPKGAPRVPHLSLKYLLPSGAEVTSLEILRVKTVKLPGSYRIYPEQGPVPISNAKRKEFLEPDPVYYNKDTYPEKILVANRTGNFSGYSIASLILNPVIYHPKTGEVEFVSEIEFRINYKVTTPKSLTWKQRQEFGKLVKSMVSNPEDISIFQPGLKSLKGLQDTVEMVVVTQSSFAPYFEDLRRWKEEKGIRCEIVLLDSIYASYSGRDNPEKIRNFIKDYYNNKGLIYVLLGGQADFENGEEIVPRRDVYYLTSGAGYYTDEDTIPSDLYYSDLDGTWDEDGDNIFGELEDNVDMYPDVIVGRFPVKNISQLSNLVNKVLTYEQNPPSGYVTNLVLPATELFWLYNYWGDTVNNAIADISPTPPWNDVKLYESLGNLSTSTFLNAINNGAGFSHYSAHGNEYGCSDFVTINDLSNMTNGDKLGIHNAISCFTGAIDEVSGGDCFAEELVNRVGGGAVASIMNTRYGWGYPPEMGPSENIDVSFYHYIFQDSILTLGEAHALSLADWVPVAYAEQDTGVYRWSIYELWIFGDPSLEVWTDEPTNINVSHPAAIPQGTPTVQIMTDQPGALVALSKNGYLVGRAIADAGGVANVQVSAPVVGGDSIKVVVTAKNRIPYIGYMTVFSSGPYVSYLGSEVNDGAGNGNGRINPGESIDLEVWVKNWGSDAATDVYGRLSTTNTNVTITCDSVYYGASIAAGDSTSGTGVFSFDVSLDATDQEVIPFTLEVHSAESSWTSNFNLVIYAPVLEFDGVVVVDTFPGCNGNGYVDPGERVSLVVGIRNTGHEVATLVSADISTSHAGVVISDGSSGFGDIEPDSVVFGEAYDVSFDGSLPQGERVDFGLSMLTGGLVFSDSFDLYVGIQYYSTDLEGQDTAYWVGEGAWHLTTRSYNSASHSYWCGNELTGEYDNYQDISLYMPPFLALENETLRFWTWYDLESGYDYGYVEVSTDGVNWTEVASYSGSSGGWVEEVLPITQVVSGDEVRIRFRFVSDVSVTYEGWYIDDIQFGPVIFIPGVEVEGYDVVFDDNSNGVIDAGENVGVVINLKNIGLQDAHNVVGVLRSLDQDAQVVDSLSSYGDILSMSVSSGDTFTFVVSSSPSDRVLPFRLYVTGDNIEDSVDMEVIIGYYVGPSSYGYYAYTDLAPYENAPAFEWVEVSGMGTLVADGDDQVDMVSLPFTFRYFGNDYTNLSISSNGWIGFGSYSSSYFSNGDIPSTDSPNNIIAGLWDDLNPTATGSGKIYYYYDDANHRFIVEWDSVYHYGSSLPEKFEIILYDPAYYTTPTGDGEIVVQYLISPTQDDFSMGIENADGSDGIGYYIDGVYGEGADEIVGARAIKFTTNAPLTGVGEDLVSGLPRRFELFAPYPNPLRGEAHVRFALPRRTEVELSVYDIQGRRVKVLARGVYDAGYYVVRFDGRDSRGRRLSQGIYFLRLKAGDYRRTRKMVLVK